MDPPVEAATDHRCALGELTVALARSRAGDRANAAAEALTELLVEGRFESCCVPHYLALAPAQAEREVQVPIAKDADIETRVILWPVGSRDFSHPHTDGWTVFVPVRGTLTEIASSDGDTPSAVELPARKPQVLRPQDSVRHRVQNRSEEVALSVHVSGER
ncbi:MAG: hypothetical protein E6J49_07795 [Chloroflexi bacterium]|nr:MAG: hypothetical protein E6J49_07795 [Chloroflexota bacterium]